MVEERFIGWDIGGAHLKMAEIGPAGEIISVHQSCTPLWQGIESLGLALADINKRVSGKTRTHSFTTTAELVDIFPDRRNGLKQLTCLVSSLYGDVRTQFYAGQTGWIPCEQTGRYYQQIASANWHATASFLARVIEEGILVDIGSTTTDIIPFREQSLLNCGYTDFERLAANELIYSGVVRTPIMALTDRVTLSGKSHPLVAELFATTADVYRLTDELREQDDMQATADGAAKTRNASARRLARMAGSDLGDMSEAVCVEMADDLANRQLQRIKQAVAKISGRSGISKNLVGAGAGKFLVAKLAKECGINYIDFTDLLEAKEDIKPGISRSATAVAVAQLARLST